MKKFMKHLEAELKKNDLSEGEIREILADHEEMIKSAMSEGLTDEEIVEKFGDPEKLAEELSQIKDKKPSKDPKDEKVFSDVKENYEVAISLINEDVEVYLHDENEILVQYFGRREMKKYNVEFVDNKLVIEIPKTISFRGFHRDDDSRFDVYLPRKIAVKTFMLKTINGDLEVDELNANKVEIQATNGDLEIENLNAVEFKVSTVNGDIDVNKAICEDFVATVVSGDIEISGLTCKNDIYMNTVSGDIEIANSTCNSASLKTVSGDLEGNEFYPKELSLKSVSGDIEINNKDKSKKIDIKSKRTVSGDISIN